MNAQKIDWNDLQLVTAVCVEGTLSGAARRLGVNHSTVFRRIKFIEEALGVRLFDRLPRGYAMTEAGEAFFAAGDKVENLVNSLALQVAGQDLRLHGDLRVAVPDGLMLEILMPAIPEFTRTHPSVKLELVVSSDYADLSRREADIAVRATRAPAEALFGRKLCNMAIAFYGQRDSVEDWKTQPPETLSWLMPDETLGQLLVGSWLAKNRAGATINFTSNTLLCLKGAAKSGLGVAPLPCFMGDHDPELARLIEPCEDLGSEIWLLTHAELKHTARVRAFMDFASGVFEGKAALLEGLQI